MAKLYYQGHGSYRITANDGRVIYVDPYAYAGSGYEPAADLILVTHQHGDHNHIRLVRQKPCCRIITNFEALVSGEYRRFCHNGVSVEAVPAGNKRHNPADCVGYMIGVDELIVYASGDTSQLECMQAYAGRGIDYALLPVDGIFNMGPQEAARCAKMIGARRSIPIHTKPGTLYCRDVALQFQAEGRLLVEPGEEIELVKGEM